MEFKIDTKETYSIITPVTDQINANLADEVWQKCNDLGQMGSKNYIINLQHINSIDDIAITQFANLHKYIYNLNKSIVFTCINERISSQFNKNKTNLIINIAPRLEEAIDIVCMEDLERELLSEEE